MMWNPIQHADLATYPEIRLTFHYIFKLITFKRLILLITRATLMEITFETDIR